ncbi:DUF4349 domain-containing protein [Roseivirga sp. BDSF3-8]|uniref:DUF4349 domain-containing protein n=1 Tax=Roseivirga sp. BDSF3-8 TaxID=3241598 RepID=UPI0035318DB4
MKNSIIIFIFLCLISCKEAPESLSTTDGASYEAVLTSESEKLATQQEEEVETDTKAENQPDKKMVRTGRLAWETDDPRETRQRIVRSLEKLDGFIAQDNEERMYNRIRYTLVLRVPNNNFDKLLTAVSEGVSHFDERDIKVVDVTARYVDLSERLKTKKELEERYRQLLKKAEKVEDMLKIERSIAAERAEIESMEGQLRLLSNQVAYSTLTIQLHKPVDEPPIATAAFGSRLTDGFKTGWELLEDIMVATVTLWPILLLIGIGIFLARWVKRRRKLRRAHSTGTTGQ